MSFTKKYLGNGRQVENLDIVRVSIPKEKLQEMINSGLTTFEGKEFLIFEVARKKEADEYGHTHHAYLSIKAEAPAAKPRRKKKGA